MEFTARQIAEFLNGEIDGNAEIKVSNISKIEDGKPGTLSFLANPKYENYIYSTNASIVLINKSFKPEKPITATLIKVENAYEAFASLLELYQSTQEGKTGIEQLSYISESAQIGENIYVGAFSYISSKCKIGKNVKIYPQVFIGENSVIADNTIIYAGVKIYHDCVIGKNCIIHSGVIIGSDGFGFAPVVNEDFKKIPQIGNVVIEDNVEIGANTTIDRATIGSTIIRKGVKLDNLIQIAHNVEIGEHTVIAALTGISGSTKIGKDCMIGGQVGLVGHITIADEVKIGAQTGIVSSIKEKGLSLIGSPGMPYKDYFRSYTVFRRLPDLDKKIYYLEKQLEELKELTHKHI